MTGDYFIHPTAEVSPKAKIGKGTKVWHGAQIREDVSIGENCIVGKNAYLDFSIKIGDNCKVQNNCSLYHHVELENGVFVGPHCVITNDKYPRAVNPDGSLKGADDWKAEKTLLKKGSAVGANSVLLGGVQVGEWAMIGAGSVVTKDVPSHAMVVGNPARLAGFVCKCGRKLAKTKETGDQVHFKCECKETVVLNKNDLKEIQDNWIG